MSTINSTLDSLATQHQAEWLIITIKNAVLWFDNVFLGLVGNVVIFTLCVILFLSYRETRLAQTQQTSDEKPAPPANPLITEASKSKFNEMGLLKTVLQHAQTELAAIKSTQPHFNVEPLCKTYHINSDNRLGPCTNSHRCGLVPEGNLASLAMLRVINRPINHNKYAIAENVYAWVSYCDSEWSELFPAFRGAWGFPSHIDGNYKFGGLSDGLQNLEPNDILYLGIAISELPSDNRSPNAHMLYSALTSTSHEYSQWLHPDFLLNQVIRDEVIYIKVTIGCHRYETMQHYVLEKIGGEDSTLKHCFVLKPIQGPSS